jgi:hypothetical protein
MPTLNDSVTVALRVLLKQSGREENCKGGHPPGYDDDESRRSRGTAWSRTKSPMVGADCHWVVAVNPWTPPMPVPQVPPMIPLLLMLLATVHWP